MGLIPKQVNLLPEIGSYAFIEKPIVETLKKGYIGIALGRLLARWKAKKFAKIHKGKTNIAEYQYIHSNIASFLPSLHYLGEYDLAISFLIPHNIVRDKVKAKQKWAWIHTDYSSLEMDTKVELPVWSAYDKIISISEDVTKGFLSKFPSLEEKILLIENILSEQFVREQADSGLEEASLEFRAHSLVHNSLNSKHSTLNLLSIGRFSHAKAFDRAVHICKALVEKRMDIRWYIIGYGGEEAKIRKAVEETGMEDYFILIGKKINPYPYIKACDVYVQPSRYEGKAVTVREAQILCKPVVITNYATAPSQVQDGIEGVIVPNDVEGAVEGIAAFLKNKQKQQAIIAYLQNHHYGNEDEVKKIDDYV
jgi:glycosyltransferase involved in cell wall biosynthesis